LKCYKFSALLFPQVPIITHAGIAAGVGRAFRCVCVCLFVHALTGIRIELSTPNLVHVYYIAVTQHGLAQRSKGQGHTVTMITARSDQTISADSFRRLLKTYLFARY